MSEKKPEMAATEPAAHHVDDLNIRSFEPLLTPTEIKTELPAPPEALATVLKGRAELRDALAGRDRRLVVILGPCSIHDSKAALEYAGRLQRLRAKVENELLIVMRVYFEKPRTTIGWKGLINDPNLDGTEDINLGLRSARKILVAVNQLGLPAATEFLDPIVPQFLADLVSWAAIGARTTESQTHREMSSGLSMPVGFKNSTDGSLQTAMDAMVSARHAHSFLGVNAKGESAIVRTRGNPDVHLVLRGGNSKPNYSPAHLAFARVSIGASRDRRLLMVDCSHGNSNKDYRRQPIVFEDLVQQVLKGEEALLGLMLESHLNEGQQKPDCLEKLKYGVSITDGCLSWETTESLLLKASEALKKKA